MEGRKSNGELGWGYERNLNSSAKMHACATRTTQLTCDLLTADEYKNDPRNPALKTATKPH